MACQESAVSSARERGRGEPAAKILDLVPFQQVDASVTTLDFLHTEKCQILKKQFCISIRFSLFLQSCVGGLVHDKFL